MMTSQELTSIVLWTAGALLLGMAGIIKTMVCWRLDRADKRQNSRPKDWEHPEDRIHAGWRTQCEPQSQVQSQSRQGY